MVDRSICRGHFASVICTLFIALHGVVVSAAEATFPGKKSDWKSYDRYDFKIRDRDVLVVTPKTPAEGKPWIWRGRFFGHRPEVDLALLAHGFHVVYMDVPEMLGSPDAVRHWLACYEYLTNEHGFSRTPALEGMSRGGLYVFNFAAAHPDKVACIYADAAVCDFKSWPGGKGRGRGSPADWKFVLQAYHFACEEEALACDKNPIDNLEPLAAKKVPIICVCGDKDEVVPYDENTGILKERYEKLGGSITVIMKPGVGHVHGLDAPQPLVDFILKHTGVK